MATRDQHTSGSQPGPSRASGSAAECDKKMPSHPGVFNKIAPLPREPPIKFGLNLKNWQPSVKRKTKSPDKVGREKETEAATQIMNQEQHIELIPMPLHTCAELVEGRSMEKEVEKEGPSGVEVPISFHPKKVEVVSKVVNVKRKGLTNGDPRRKEVKAQRNDSSGKPHRPPEFRMYKVVYDPAYMKHLKTKDFVRREYGKCPDKYKQLDYPQVPMDPRVRFRRVDQAKNLPIPNFVIDDQYTGIPPKREVTISNLNDNVNKEFLEKMCRTQKLEPKEVLVFHHPKTRKHLQMAHILFANSKDASAFVESNNGGKVMGEPIICKLDPFAAELSAMYTAISEAPLPALSYLARMSEHGLSLRREKIIGSTAGPTPPVSGSANENEKDRSLSPMEMAYSPNVPGMDYDVQPKYEPLLEYQQQAHYGASTSKNTPPPPYSERPSTYHGTYEDRTKSESRKRGEEFKERSKSREKHRRGSTSSSSYGSSPADDNGSHHRSDGNVKKKQEEYVKVKRYVSSERNSTGDKRIVKEVQTVTYTRRTEQRTLSKVSPDSFDEEMKRRARGRNTRNSETRGKDDMRWSSPSSDSDNEGARRKRGKERGSESQSKEEERRPPPPAVPVPTTSSTTPAPSRRSRFSAPIFDPSQPPPMIVPPVGLVLPNCSVPPPAPPAHIPMPSMMVPPPPLPGMCSLPPGVPPPPPMMMAPMTPMTPMGYPATPLPPHHYPSPAIPVKNPLKPHLVEAAAAAAASPVAAVASPRMMPRTTSGSSLTAAGRTPAENIAHTTPPTSSEGGSTPRSSGASTTAATEKKGNLDDRLKQLFGIQKKKEEEAREMKTSASAPSISALASEQRERDDDDMEIDDDDMDVASSSSTESRGGGMMMRGEERQTEEERRKKEEAELMRMEEEVAKITKMTLDKLIPDLEQQVGKDLSRKMEISSMNALDKYMKRRQQEGEEKKKQMIRDSLAAAAARDASLVTPKKDPMEEMLAAKLRSPEQLMGRMGGISKVFSMINIAKKKKDEEEFSRDGTPALRDSRAQSKSRSDSRSPSRSATSSVESSSDSDEEERTDDEVRKAVRRRPNMRNLESSQSSAASSSSSESESDNDFELDVVGMGEDEAERVEEQCGSPSTVGRSPRASETVGVAVVTDEQLKEVKMEELEEPEVYTVENNLAEVKEEMMEDEELEEEGEEENEERMEWAMPPTTPSTCDAVQQDLLQQHPTMRPDEDGYDPIRYDHPYVVHLGVPFTNNQSRRSVVVDRFSKGEIAATAAAQAKGEPVCPARIPSPARVNKETKKRTKDKISNEVIGLLSSYPVPKKPKLEKKEKPRKIFEKRSEEEELRIRDSFKAGMDEEDEFYLQKMLADMQLNGAKPFGVDKVVEFESRIRAYTPMELPKPAKLGKLEIYYDDDDLAGIVPHSTGCARTQGFYRLTSKQKIRIMRRPEAFQDKTEINERDEVVTRHQVQAQKEQRSMNRRLQTIFDANPNSEFFKVNQLKYRKKMIKFARSRIHGWGLYALEPIAPDDMIVEYIGEKVRPIVADEREKQYEKRGIGSSYLFRVDDDEVIDATKQGNFARFINHSCQPNCYAKVISVDGDKRMVIYSKSLIQKGDEITYDYKFPIEDNKVVCLCGAPSCRGTLN